jgi:hypothetical protein
MELERISKNALSYYEKSQALNAVKPFSNMWFFVPYGFCSVMYAGIWFDLIKKIDQRLKIPPYQP